MSFAKPEMAAVACCGWKSFESLRFRRSTQGQMSNFQPKYAMPSSRDQIYFIRLLWSSGSAYPRFKPVRTELETSELTILEAASAPMGFELEYTVKI